MTDRKTDLPLPARLRERIDRLDDALAGVEVQIHYLEQAGPLEPGQIGCEQTLAIHRASSVNGAAALLLAERLGEIANALNVLAGLETPDAALRRMGLAEPAPVDAPDNE